MSGYTSIVIGLGQIGMGYDYDADSRIRVASLSAAFATHPKFELVAGVDSCEKRRRLFKSKFRLPSYGALLPALEEHLPSVVAISVPTNIHYQIFKETIESEDIKAILCEKPLSFDINEAFDMVQQAEEQRILLFVNYMRRCDSSVIEIKRRIQANEIRGELKGVCWYSKGLFNNGSHFINLFQYWLGKVVNFKILEPGRVWKGQDPEPDVKVDFELGSVYLLAAKEENYSHYTVELVAENGRLRYERGTMIWQATANDSNNSGYTVLAPEVEVISSEPLKLQWAVMAQLAAAMDGEEATICTGADGLETLRIISKIKDAL
jgi:predicted dehydrogenase